jgi:imidazolonepropionase
VYRVFVDIAQLVLPFREASNSRAPIEVIKDAAIAVDEEGRVGASGTRAEVERAISEKGPMERISLDGRAVVPGLVDSHTHTVYAGERIDEMGRRCRGETYEEIAAAGGGIANSAARLQRTDHDTLVAAAEKRLGQMLARGTTTVEIKSGYGLTPEAELKQLEVIETLGKRVSQTIVPTLLLHTVPKTHAKNRAEYLDLFAEEVLEVAAKRKLARYFDAFIERNVFEQEEVSPIIERAKALGLGIKLHVDQMFDGGGARFAASVGALSADHLEYTSQPGADALAASGGVATILPGCGLFLGKGPWPDGRRLRDAGCEVAVATDFNPGSSHVFDLLLCGTLAATRCGLTLEETLWGVTQGGAKALSLNTRGNLHPGCNGDFVVVGQNDWRALFYTPGAPPVAAVYIAGQQVAG